MRLPETSKLERVVVTVKDIEEAKKFWGDLLETKFNTVNVTQSSGATNIAALSPVGFELIQAVDPPSDQEGLGAFVLRVKNLSGMIKKMKGKGFEPKTVIEIDNLKEALYTIRGVTFLFAQYKGPNYGLKVRRR